MKETNKTLFYDVLILIGCITFFVIGIFNVLNYSDILKDKNDENLGLSRTWIQACFWLNIIVVCITGYFMFYSILKLIFRPDLKFKDYVKQIFGDKAKKDYDMTISVGRNPMEGIQVATAMAVNEARKSGKSLSESMKIGTIAGTYAGMSAGITKGDSKIISKIAAENVIKNELSKYTKPINKE